jgi:hypothetical protein
MTELERFVQGSSAVYWYEGEDRNDGAVNVDEDKGALEVDDRSMQNVED